jgi:predicted transcriptional regulator/DNA-binding transcriptional ArsR family regulator
MKIEVATEGAEKNNGLAEMLRTLDAECRNCAPLTPLECITNCHIWKMKNEFRRLRQTMENPNFTKDLFNVLKNNIRIHILKAIVKGRYSVSKLQEELKKIGHSHSQDTINQEYLRPLLEVGLAAEAQDQYYATTFGSQLTELLESFPEFVDVLPAHSECYEETLLNALMSGPKTFEDVEAFLSPKIASRILKRLKTAGLIEPPKERDYVFFFRSKRDPNLESLSSSETRVYGNLSEGGISAKKLARKTGISLRRTYRYLRALKGKKLVFVRKTPQTYGLTDKGEKLASFLHELQNFVQETWNSSEQIINGDKS